MEITEDIKKAFLEYLDVVENLAKENAELKEELEELRFYIDSYKITWEIDKYKQTLSAIKEICEKNLWHKSDYDNQARILDLIKESEQ